MARWLATAAMVTGLAALAPSGVATADSNSGAADLCQNGGWMTIARADHTRFRNQGECVAYGAHGGTLTGSELLCESFGGTFAIGTTPGVLWTCRGFAISSGTESNQLADTCLLVDGGTLFFVAFPSPGWADATCAENRP